MGSALLKGITAGLNDQDLEVRLYSRTLESAQQLVEKTKGVVCDSITQLVKDSDIILLGVKPAQIKNVLNSDNDWSGKLVVSLAAGVPLSSLCELAGEGARVIRVMPNTPALIGEGACAYCVASNVTEKDIQTVDQLLSCVGAAVLVPESLMDGVTGLSGSGPGYVLTIIEALTDAGVQQGLPRPLALKLVCQTLKGTAMLVEQTGEHPASLRDQVTSPGGTTIAGLAALEKCGIRPALHSAVATAAQRSIELG